MNKVLHIGFSFNPLESGRGGAVLYQWSLAKVQADLGLEVVFLHSSRHTITGRMGVVEEYVEGLKCLEIINSPIRPYDYSQDPRLYLRNARLENLFRGILLREKPDVIHLHDHRLLPISIIDCARSLKIPAVKTIHNYYDLCSQSELMYKGRKPCLDYQEGTRCRECLGALPGISTFNQRLAGQLRNSPLLPHLRSLNRRIRGPKNSNGAGNSITHSADLFRRRREGDVMMLNRLSGIHCSSARSAEILSQHGVNRSRISVLPITSPLIGDIQPRPPATPGKYIVFGYLSGENFLKGYDLLIRAFSRLNSNGARLVLYGFNDAERLTRTCGHPDIVFRGPYSPEDLNRVLSEIDVGVVPSLWEEVFGLIGIEFLQAGIPVIGSRIGGIPEWLRNNEDGFHFESGHEEDLADKMKRFIDNPTLVNDMPHGTPSHDDMSCHASDVIELYRSLPEIQSAPSGGPVP